MAAAHEAPLWKKKRLVATIAIACPIRFLLIVAAVEAMREIACIFRGKKKREDLRMDPFFFLLHDRKKFPLASGLVEKKASPRGGGGTTRGFFRHTNIILLTRKEKK